MYATGFFYIKLDKVRKVTEIEAEDIVDNEETFYILDGLNARPLASSCLTLFISSPRSDYFKTWLDDAKVTSSYFPVWSLHELSDCRMLCYEMLTQEVVEDRYRQYGGIPRYMFWEPSEPPSLEGALADSDARKCIHAVHELSRMFPLSHMLLHITVDENFHFQHLVLASRYVGTLLFARYFRETLDRLKELLGGGGGLAGHLFECYVHYLFENGYDEPLDCRSLEGLSHSVLLLQQKLMHSLPGDNGCSQMTINPRNVDVFSSIPKSLSDYVYYVLLSRNFPAVDALTKDWALQYTITGDHPIKGVHTVNQLAKLYPDQKLPLLFIVPKSLADQFKKQPIHTAKGSASKSSSSVHQWVAGLPIDIDASPIDTPTKKCRAM